MALLSSVQKQFDLHDLAIEDANHAHQRPKIEQYGDGLFIVARTAQLIEGRIALESALPHLSERERLVLRLRFVEDMTQSQIAEQIGHSQMHVSRILRRTLARIRERIEEAESGGPGDVGR